MSSMDQNIFVVRNVTRSRMTGWRETRSAAEELLKQLADDHDKVDLILSTLRDEYHRASMARRDPATSSRVGDGGRWRPGDHPSHAAYDIVCRKLEPAFNDIRNAALDPDSHDYIVGGSFGVTYEVIAVPRGGTCSRCGR